MGLQIIFEQKSGGEPISTAGFLVICRDLYIKDVIAAFTFCPDFTLVGFHDRFRYAKTQAVAAVDGTGFVCPIKTLEYIF